MASEAVRGRSNWLYINKIRNQKSYKNMIKKGSNGLGGQNYSTNERKSLLLLTVSTMSVAEAVKLASELSFTWKGSQQALEVPSEPMATAS